MVHVNQSPLLVARWHNHGCPISFSPLASIDHGDTEECFCQSKVGVTGIETGMAAIYILRHDRHGSNIASTFLRMW